MCYSAIMFYILFFFSSRRRHTRLQGDWSSDVCSSDLMGVRYATRQRAFPLFAGWLGRVAAREERRAVQRAVEARPALARSEERRVGKERRARGRPYQLTTKA